MFSLLLKYIQIKYKLSICLALYWVYLKYRLIIMRSSWTFFISTITWHNIQQLSINLLAFNQLVQLMIWQKIHANLCNKLRNRSQKEWPVSVHEHLMRSTFIAPISYCQSKVLESMLSMIYCLFSKIVSYFMSTHAQMKSPIKQVFHWIIFFSKNLHSVDSVRLCSRSKVKLCMALHTNVQVNNYEIVANFFHISHDIQQLSINLPEFTQFVQLMNWQNNSCI